MKALVVFFAASEIEPGPIEEARALLRAVEARFGHSLDVSVVEAGGEPWSVEALATCRNADVIWAGQLPEREGGARRPWPSRLRRELGVPARVRPLRGGAISARGNKTERNRSLDALVVSLDAEVEAAEVQDAKLREVARVGAELAHQRWGLLTLVQPPSGSASGANWEARVREAVAEVPSIRYEVVSPGEAMQRMSSSPGSLDVLLADGRVADTLCEEAPSGPNGLAAFLGERTRGLYPLDRANSAQGILSVALGLRCSLRLEREATAVEGALAVAWAAGVGEGGVLWEAAHANLIADLTTSLAI